MHDSPTNLICRHVFETHRLVADFPPRLIHPNKRIVYRIACPPGCVHTGRLVFSRWREMTLPDAFPSARQTVFEAREDLFGYEPASKGSAAVEWYLNFADHDLFCAYGGPLFAQDEMQVAEHPALGSLREALLHSGVDPATVEDGEPTPVLILGVERRCAVATDRNAALGRPFGLYGNYFARARPDVIERSVKPIVPPTTTNLIAMEAPAYGQGAYNLEQIHYILRTAFTGFSAAMIESGRESTRRPEVVIHTGFWGCGAYGGNRVLMTLLQLLAAHLSDVDRLVFHTGHESGSDAFDRAKRALEHDLIPVGRKPGVSSLLREIEAIGFQWGTSDGT